MPVNARKITHNQTLVLETLKACSGPLSAYQIMDKLTDQGITAPPTVYRALNQLIKRGVVHRIDSLNAYIACEQDSSDGHPHQGEAAFAICQDCGDVAEFVVAPTVKPFQQALDKAGFVLSQAKVELIGTCQTCKREISSLK
ncbi:MAG: transcriptional repressor [Fimbriimonadaceae bacterium]|nr:transcriptional repressor [Alphaproteobacteria bacterium]